MTSGWVKKGLKNLLILILVSWPVFVSAEDRTYGTPPKHAPSSEGERLFQESGCVMCHGYEGRGDGILAAGLNPKPRDFTSYEEMKHIPYMQMELAIRHGSFGTAMPSFSHFTDEQIHEIIAYLRSLFSESYLTINMCVSDNYIIDTNINPDDFRVEVDDPEKMQVEKDGRFIRIKALNWPALLAKKVHRSYIRLIGKNKTISLIAVRFHRCLKDLQRTLEMCECKEK